MYGIWTFTRFTIPCIIVLSNGCFSLYVRNIMFLLILVKHLVSPFNSSSIIDLLVRYAVQGTRKSFRYIVFFFSMIYILDAYVATEKMTASTSFNLVVFVTHVSFHILYSVWSLLLSLQRDYINLS